MSGILTKDNPTKKMKRPTTILGIRSLVKKINGKEGYLGSYHHLPNAAKFDRPSKPRAPRRGHIPMYMGEESKRYKVPVRYLNLPELVQVMNPPVRKIDGPLRVYCSTELFDELLLKLAKVK